jgi:hypothetical protein
MADEETISTETFRVGISNLALQVQTERSSFGIRAGRGQPRYQFAALALVDPERVRACVRVTPDEFRRKSGEIRALVRLEDVPFGILIRKEVKAIFQRHPSYRPTAAERYREEYLARQGKMRNELGDSLRSLEARMSAIELKQAASRDGENVVGDRVRDLEARVTKLEGAHG